MSARFVISGSKATIASGDCVIQLIGGTTRRVFVRELTVSFGGTPADYNVEYQLRRTTTAGSGGSSVTPQAYEPAEPAAVSTARAGDTTAPTFTSGADLLYLACNTRVTYRYPTAPDYPWVIAATSNAGLGLRVDAVSTSAKALATIVFDE